MIAVKKNCYNCQHIQYERNTDTYHCSHREGYYTKKQDLDIFKKRMGSDRYRLHAKPCCKLLPELYTMIRGINNFINFRRNMRDLYE